MGLEGEMDVVEEELPPRDALGGADGEKGFGIQKRDCRGGGGFAEDGIDAGIGPQPEGIRIAGAGEEGGGFGCPVVQQGHPCCAEEGFGVGGIAPDRIGKQAGGFDPVGGGLGGQGGTQFLPYFLCGRFVLQVAGGEGGAIAEVDGDGAGDDHRREAGGFAEDFGQVLAKRQVGRFEAGVLGGEASLEGNGLLVAPGIGVDAGGEKPVDGGDAELGKAGAGKENHQAGQPGAVMEVAQSGGGAVGTGYFVVARQENHGVGLQSFQVAGHFPQDVGIAAIDGHLDDFDGVPRIAALEHELHLASEAEGGIGGSHGFGAAQQADAQGAGFRGFQGHDGEGGVGEALRKEAVHEELVVDPGWLSVGFPVHQEPGGAAGEEAGRHPFEEDKEQQENEEGDSRSPEQPEGESHPGGQFNMGCFLVHATQVGGL